MTPNQPRVALLTPEARRELRLWLDNYGISSVDDPFRRALDHIDALEAENAKLAATIEAMSADNRKLIRLRWASDAL